ncbi:membrane progestin receptor delta [Rhinatrema bivittatum]|uniref:membrane progestin receptor delta n=1 Tax=Rhinatrema bivittatum TaxID=194408 RepID=UPI00112969D7|nr:membrane progestin receptor delta [Rhinatrema bivittatum]XP_029436464.1 membrane progestin receptor delta [Rhinatrema bivittatum]XP_029436465.1 membrane progestin receptor delta [Rhinatrema bivittatum]
MLTVKLPQLLNIHQVPRVFREDGIISGYRPPKSSALECILSSFRMTNETLNIWTHFLPTWYFLWRLLVLSSSLDFRSDPYNWPLLVYLLLICLYPFTSSCAHTFSTMSPRALHLWYFLDYGALSLYSLGCAFTYSAYVMPDRWLNSPLHLHFTPLATLNSFICTALSCYSRFLELDAPKLSKVLRTAAFVHPFIFDNVPLLYRFLFCSWDAAVPQHFYHLLFAFLTGFLFASHLPERLAPGRFDYIGHSHQLFHVCAVVGTHFQLEAILADMSSRKPWLTSHTPPTTLFGIVGIVGVAMVGNLGIIGLFTGILLWSPRAASILQSTVPEGSKLKE